MEHGETWQQVRRQLTDVADAIDGALRRMPGIGSFVRGSCPPVSVYEGADDIVVLAEVPGVAREALEVTLLAGTLTIRGKRQPEEHEGYECRLHERGAEEFSRELALPAPVNDDADIAASLTEGVLTVRLQRRQPERGRSIEVSAQ